ncbi:hypothetical protein [Arthrobacter agilis]|uniref:hypothetical protein n=1 Tax=Arthrobacter agilis TaxID=37921 RepID=UPI002789974B|nr:hypothetical protein [Arthrobacter agilis]MDQ0736906.1 hypothetical protein [Arthrobacter agilis]
MNAPSPAVDALLEQSDHPLRDALLCLRSSLPALPLALGEHVTWNAPSHVHDGDELVLAWLRA